MTKRFSQSTKDVLESFINYSKDMIDFGFNPYQFFNIDMHKEKKAYWAAYNLKRRGYMQSIKKKNKIAYKLTKKGKRSATQLAINKMIQNKNWDKKWRILIFDIPETRRSFRDNLRKSLIDIGFYQLQKSVWIFPYDVKDYLYDIIPGFREGDWFQYIEAGKISSEDKLKKRFGVG